MYVWFSSLGFPHTTLEFPYKRQSPITKKNRDYCNSEEVEDEIMNLSDTFQDSKFTIGRNLYFHIPLFANPKWFIEDEYIELIKEFNYNEDGSIKGKTNWHKQTSGRANSLATLMANIFVDKD